MQIDAGSSLKKVLRPIHIWAIGVGLVISGEYFGWNYGWQAAGTVGFLIATLVVTVLYITFIFSFTELTAMIPHAGGPFAYAHRALGPIGGFIAGYATLVEFLLAPPAIALALGSYAHFLHPALPVISTALACYVIFTAINLLGIKESAVFTLFITILAVGELLVFTGIVAPHFKTENFLANAFPLSFKGIFASIPFAIWFYLAIEGVAMVAEEVKDPQRNIARGYISAISTLVVLALGVMIFTAGIGDWRTLSNIDYPLPEAISMVLGKQSGLTKLFAGIGLFGLIASFHSIILGYSREIFALARAGYLPSKLADLHPKFKTPHWALIGGGMVGMLAILTRTTGQVITISAIGALAMYIVSTIAVMILRKKEPGANRPFKTPFYPWFPIIALLLSIMSLFAVIWFNPKEGVLFFGLLFLFLAIFIGMGKHKPSKEGFI
ncbi:MAG: ethanolamine permease [Bacteroidota bacterium]